MKKRIALVIGGAQCVWNDIKSALNLFKPDLVIAINDIGVEWPQNLDHWVSYHSDQLLKWVDKRKELGLPPAKQLWTGPAYPRGVVPSVMKSLPCYGGSSGFLAVTLGVEIEHCKVILAGVPMDPAMPHFNQKFKGAPWIDGRNYQKHWLENQNKLKDDVRSFSGYTRQLFGEPTKEWIEQ